MTWDAAVRFRPAPPALSDSTKKGTRSSSWNCRTSAWRFLTSVSPCNTSPGRAESRAKKGRHWGCDLAELGEDQQLLLLCRDDFRDLAQACQLSAVTLSPRAIAKPLRWVIADLLEAHQECQHHAFARDPVGRSQLSSQLGDASLVQS